MKRFYHAAMLCLLGGLIFSQLGCAVPQRPGKGFCQRLVEPETQSGYWLYLPEDYVLNNGKHTDNERWPVVLTLHGLKPYDNANPQVREWQEEADRYGFIIIAPELVTCDSLTMQFPLRDPDLPYVKRDERAILAIMDEVFRRTNADPSRVLATSFSSGGYMAHFMVNRHPDRFCCLAVRGSNFNEQLLNTAQIPKYRDMPVAIFFGENDLSVCAEESMRAVDWYRRYRFSVQAKKVAGLGHQRRPQTAAAFFASAIGVEPKTPPELGTLVMQEVMPTSDARPVVSGSGAARPTRPADRALVAKPRGHSSPRSSNGSVYSSTDASPASNEPIQITPAEPTTRVPTTVREAPVHSPTPRRPR